MFFSLLYLVDSSGGARQDIGYGIVSSKD